jgi:hypothetical protein
VDLPLDGAVYHASTYHSKEFVIGLREQDIVPRPARQEGNKTLHVLLTLAIYVDVNALFAEGGLAPSVSRGTGNVNQFASICRGERKSIAHDVWSARCWFLFLDERLSARRNDSPKLNLVSTSWCFIGSLEIKSPPRP